MARARNIKPGFFTNDELCELPALARLLWAGLWTLCDRAGRVEDRPKKIKAEVMPYDDFDADEMLSMLAEKDFILRYEVAGVRIIQVTKWEKHQNPHVKEAASLLPEPVKPGASTVQVQGSAQPLPELAGLIPDSGFRIPDSLVPTPDGAAKPSRKKPRVKLPDDFEPDELGKQHCVDAGFSCGEELPKFRNHHEAAGTLMANWQAAWRMWIDKAKKFRKPWEIPKGVTTPGPVGPDPALKKIADDAKLVTPASGAIREKISELSKQLKVAH